MEFFVFVFYYVFFQGNLFQIVCHPCVATKQSLAAAFFEQAQKNSNGSLGHTTAVDFMCLTRTIKALKSINALSHDGFSSTSVFSTSTGHKMVFDLPSLNCDVLKLHHIGIVYMKM